MDTFLKLLPAAKRRYDVDHSVRYYHNYDHAISVVTATLLISPDASTELQLAALYHDAVYVPGAGADANECCSAAALGVDWREAALPASGILAHAQELIKYTSVLHHVSKWPVFGELAVLLDADLSPLAAPYPTFFQNQSNIILENGGELTAENYKLSTKFLEQFLTCRTHIYHTPYGQTHWETQARANIETYVAQYLTL